MECDIILLLFFPWNCANYFRFIALGLIICREKIEIPNGRNYRITLFIQFYGLWSGFGINWIRGGAFFVISNIVYAMHMTSIRQVVYVAVVVLHMQWAYPISSSVLFCCCCSCKQNSYHIAIATLCPTDPQNGNCFCLCFTIFCWFFFFMEFIWKRMAQTYVTLFI